MAAATPATSSVGNGMSTRGYYGESYDDSGNYFQWPTFENGTDYFWFGGGGGGGGGGAARVWNANNGSGRADDAANVGYTHLWTLWLLVFPALTVFGNVLVVLGVYRERSLQSATNYFIVSLAIADIMVAILVMPLAVYVEVIQMFRIAFA